MKATNNAEISGGFKSFNILSTIISHKKISYSPNSLAILALIYG